MFPNLVNFQSPVAPKSMGAPHKCTLLEPVIFLLSSNAFPSFIAYCILELQLLSPDHVHCHAPGSCCKVMTHHYRYTEAVGSNLNYMQAKYGAPTGSSLNDRTGTKHSSRAVVNLATFPYHVTRSSVQVRKRVGLRLSFSHSPSNE